MAQQNIPLINTAKGYERFFATPAPLEHKHEAEVFLARNRELIDEALWLVSEWYLDSELVAHQQSVTGNSDLTVAEVASAIKKALKKTARVSGRIESSDISRFRFESCKRRIANLESRLEEEPELDQNAIAELKKTTDQLRYHHQDQKGRKKVSFFGKDEVFQLPPEEDGEEKDEEGNVPDEAYDGDISLFAQEGDADAAGSNSISVPKTTRTRHGRGAAPRPNPDLPTSEITARYPTSAAQHAERALRFETFGPRVSYFATRTQQSRLWVGYHSSHQNVRNAERVRISARIPELEAELERARRDLEEMKWADQEEERLYGDRVREGAKNSRLLEEFEKFLRLESESEPELDDEGFLVGEGVQDEVEMGDGEEGGDGVEMDVDEDGGDDADSNDDEKGQ